jgi:phenylacetate-CoA ligase
MASLDELIARVGYYILSIQNRNTRTLWHAHRVLSNLHRSNDQIEAEVFANVVKIVDYAYSNCPFYRRRYQEAGYSPGDLKRLSDLSKLPALDKSDIRQYSNEMISSAFRRENLTTALSGGTTGTPITTYRDKECLAFRRGIDVALARYYGWKYGQWQGWLWGATADLVYPKTRLALLKQRWAERRYYLDAFRLDNQTYQKFVDQTKQYRPTYVSAYPSVAYDLALRIDSGEVDPVRMPIISVTAEPLYDYQREKIEAVLTDRLYERYGAREIGTVAFECSARSGLHIFSESVYVESEPIPGRDDQVGMLYFTHFGNTAMPLIRYRIGDLGAIVQGKCDCGLCTQRLSRIQGRDVDAVWRPDGTGIVGVRVVDMIAEACLQTRVQVVQEKIDLIVVNIQGDAKAYGPQLEAVIKTFRERIGENITYEIRSVEHISREASGKYRYVVSKVKRPEGR